MSGTEELQPFESGGDDTPVYMLDDIDEAMADEKGLTNDGYLAPSQYEDEIPMENMSEPTDYENAGTMSTTKDSTIDRHHQYNENGDRLYDTPPDALRNGEEDPRYGAYDSELGDEEAQQFDEEDAFHVHDENKLKFKGDKDKHSRLKCVCLSLMCFIAIILAAAIGLFIALFYSGSLDRFRGVTVAPVEPVEPDFTSSAVPTSIALTTLPRLDLPPIDMIEVPATLKLDQQYTDSYNTPTSPEYMQLANEITNTMDDTFRNDSRTKDIYDGTKINGFKSGSIITDLLVLLRGAPVIAKTEDNENLSDEQTVEYVQVTIQNMVFDVISSSADQGNFNNIDYINGSLDVQEANLTLGVPTTQEAIPTTEKGPTTTQGVVPTTEKGPTEEPPQCDDRFEFACKDGIECVLSFQECNGQPDCKDGSDEHGLCGACKDHEFQCIASEKCIDNRKVCDGLADCDDGSDEVQCATTPSPMCESYEIPCADGVQCIYAFEKCDGFMDCDDGSDEDESCQEPTTKEPVARTEEPGTTDEPVTAGVETTKDMPTTSESGDECLSSPCMNGGFCNQLDGGGYTCFCLPGFSGPTCEIVDDPCTSNPCLNGGECVNLIFSYVCLCAPGTTGDHCETNAVPTEGPQTTDGSVSCREDEFRCDYGRCIPAIQECNGYIECEDFSDEGNCGCQFGEFRCDNGDCITVRFTCNGQMDCTDGSDESAELCGPPANPCESVPCLNGGTCEEDKDTGYRCTCSSAYTGSNCEMEVDPTLPSTTITPPPPPTPPPSIPPTEMPGTTPPPATTSQPPHTPTPGCEGFEFTCNNGNCIFFFQECDGTDDCGDNSDEHDLCAVTQAPTTPPVPSVCEDFEFECTNQECVYAFEKCDGKEDCTDGSDEVGCDFTEAPTTPPIPGVCEDFEFECANQDCVYVFQKCDGNKDCTDGSDEVDCNLCGDITPPTNFIYKVPSDHPSDEFTCLWRVTAPVGQRVYAEVNSLTSEVPGRLSFGPDPDADVYPYSGISYRSYISSLLDVVTPVGENVLFIGLSAYAPYTDDSFEINLSTTSDTDIQTCGDSRGGHLQVLPDDMICNGFRDCFYGEDETELCPCEPGHVECVVDPCDGDPQSLCPAGGLDVICLTNTCGECSAAFYEPSGRRISDEECGNPAPTTPPIPGVCEAFEFECANRECVYVFQECDGSEDCSDGSDEMGCDVCGDITPPTNFFYKVPSDHPSDEFACLWRVTAPIGQRVYAEINSFTSEGRGRLYFGPDPDADVYPYSGITYRTYISSLLDVVTPVGENILFIGFTTFAPYTDDSFEVNLSTTSDADIRTCGDPRGGDIQVLPDDMICNGFRDCFYGEDETELCPCEQGHVECVADPCGGDPQTLCPADGLDVMCLTNTCGECSAAFYEFSGRRISDEECGSSITQAPTTPPIASVCVVGEFKCANQECVLAYQVCDRNEDCTDGSDEVGCDLSFCQSANPCQNGAECIDTGIGVYMCHCNPGFTGRDCEKDIDECASSPCGAGGICLDLINQFTCVCLNGYTGPLCKADIVECQSSPCLNGGTCTDLINGFSCTCPSQFTGLLCEDYSPTEVTPCSSEPCLNGATCQEFSLFDLYICACPTGYFGINCEERFDPCFTQPCRNGGTCFDGGDTYVCSCPAGYSGINCETETGPCSSEPCLNGGTCEELDFVDWYICSCPSGYFGVNCELNLNPGPCSSQPCINGGTCGEQADSYVCTCAQGYTGINCEETKEDDECTSMPCQNDGSCIISGSGGYTCQCKPGYTGIYCELSINECESEPCMNEGICADGENAYFCLCQSGYTGAHCENTIAGHNCQSAPCSIGASCEETTDGYTCNCLDGFTGTHCETLIDYCADMPCLNDGTCYPGQGGFFCICNLGFSGTNCEIGDDPCSTFPCLNGGSCTATDIGYTCDCLQGFYGLDCELETVECASEPCQNGGTCFEGVASYFCFCPAEFQGTNCEISPDIDECESGPCFNGGFCLDNINSFQCACLPGFSGTMCEIDIDECALASCVNGICRDGVNSYTCNCFDGYSGSACDIDVRNECASNPCLNGGTCTDRIGEYTCSCPPGWEGLNCEINIDECASNPCVNDGQCLDAINEFTCLCPPFYLGTRCERRLSVCAYVCQNGGRCVDEVDGTLCICVPGYNGTLCENNIDECASNPCLNAGQCVDAVNGYSCLCTPGWTGPLCETDILECSSDPCQNGGECFEGPNRYFCLCSPGFNGTNCENDVLECSSDPCQNGGTCTEGVNGYFCLCSPGFSGTNCENDIDKCASNPCVNGQCVDAINGYSCLCTPGWTGTLCEMECPGGVQCANGQCNDDMTCTCQEGWTGPLCDMDLGECASSPCVNGQCVDGVNGYTCTCQTGWEGELCDVAIGCIDGYFQCPNTTMCVPDNKQCDGKPQCSSSPESHDEYGNAGCAYNCVLYQDYIQIMCQDDELPYESSFFPNYVTEGISGYQTVTEAALNLRILYRQRGCDRKALRFMCAASFPSCPLDPEVSSSIGPCRSTCEQLKLKVNCMRGFDGVGLDLADLCNRLPTIPIPETEDVNGQMLCKFH